MIKQTTTVLDNEFGTANSGAQREALGVPYMRQLPMEGLAAGAAALEYGAMKRVYLGNK
jgi:hypothetical protein